MSEQSQQSDNAGSVEAAIDTIEKTELAHTEFPFSLFEKAGNKTTKLLATSGEAKPVDSRHRWFEYEFKTPVFVSFIRVWSEKLAAYHTIEFKIVDADGKERKLSATPKEGQTTVQISEFAKSIAFRPPSVFFSRPKINRVHLWGFRKNDVRAFLDSVSNIQKIKSDAIAEIQEERGALEERAAIISGKERELANVEDDIAEKSSQRTEIASDVDELVREKSSLETQVSNISGNLEAAEEQLDKRKRELSTTTQKREDIKLEISRAESELKKLTDNINLFPSEIAGFADQANQDNTKYLNFVVGLVGIIAILFIWVLAGSFDLSEFVKDHPEQDVWPILAAKLPVSLVTAAIVAACYKLSAIFIKEVMMVNRQRLSLTKVSIIAKDISQAADHDLELDEDERIALRLKVKMAMLGDHLKTIIASEPDVLFPKELFSQFSEDTEDSEIVDKVVIDPEEIRE